MDLFLALSDKRTVLFTLIDELIRSRTPANEPEVDRMIARAQSELQLVKAILDDLREELPVSFPSDEQLRTMRDAVARMQVMIDRGDALNDLLIAADELIQAFPRLGN